MIAFIIPFRSKNSSGNWAYHSALINRTIRSLCNQEDKNFKVIVVYTDFPENKIVNEHVTYLEFPFPFLKAKEIEDFDSYVKKYYEEAYAQNEMDQARRTIFGCKYAIENGCKYIMSVDADDLVSDKLVGFVNRNLTSNAPGWYVNKGYVYLEGKKYIYRYPKNLNQFCASTYIIRADLVTIPDLASKNLIDYNFFSSHAWLKDRLRDYKHAVVEPLPFRGVVYILNSASWTNYGSKFKGAGIKKWAKFILFAKLITTRLRNEFALQDIDKELWKR